MYAIIQDGGHQYRVEPGSRVRVQLKDWTEGDTVTFDQVRLIGGDGDARVGQPFVDGAKVEAKVTRAESKGKKIDVVFFRRRKGSRRHIGHRQKYTEVEITGISG